MFESVGLSETPPKIKIEEGKPWWTIDSAFFTLVYRNKRYKLYDKINDIFIYNLLPSYSYIIEKIY
jgi:hypothetical protein